MKFKRMIYALFVLSMTVMLSSQAVASNSELGSECATTSQYATQVDTTCEISTTDSVLKSIMDSSVAGHHHSFTQELDECLQFVGISRQTSFLILIVASIIFPIFVIILTVYWVRKNSKKSREHSEDNK